MWDEIACPFSSVNDYTVEVWELINNFILSHTLLGKVLLIHARIKVKKEHPFYAICNSWSKP